LAQGKNKSIIHAEGVANSSFVRNVIDSVRIPVKWSGDSGDVGQCRSEATLAGLRMIQVDHIRQEVAL
jgi:hypothetical protein